MPRAAFPAFELHPDVWLIVGTIAAAYAIALVRLAPAHAPEPRRPATRLQITCFTAGLVTMWIASDWPIHELGERYLYSIHMVQHLTYSLVCAPLLLLGMPAWLTRLSLERSHLLGIVRVLSRFVPAMIVYNVVVIVTHVPAVVSWGLRNGVAHFSLHALLLTSSLIVWMPVVSPLPDVPRLQPPLRMLYLFTQSVLPTIPASFLAYGTHPLYKDYEHFARLWGISVESDQNIAGTIMKTGAGLVLWVVIAIVFFRWFASEDTNTRPVSRKLSRDLDRDLLGLHHP
jgi:putative membrane protein